MHLPVTPSLSRTFPLSRQESVVSRLIFSSSTSSDWLDTSVTIAEILPSFTCHHDFLLRALRSPVAAGRLTGCDGGRSPDYLRGRIQVLLREWHPVLHQGYGRPVTRIDLPDVNLSRCRLSAYSPRSARRHGPMQARHHSHGRAGHQRHSRVPRGPQCRPHGLHVGFCGCGHLSVCRLGHIQHSD